VHELSIAMSIVDIATEEAARLGGRVSAVHLRLGALVGLVPECLLTSFEMASQDSPIAGSRLVIEEMPVMAFCPQCGGERRIASIQALCCSECGSPTPQVSQGRELELVGLEIES